MIFSAAISTILGIFGGLLPDIWKEVRESRDHARQLELMQMQSELQLKMLDKQLDGKLAEIQANLVIEEVRAFGEQMKAIYKQQAPVGVKWIDGFNALIRPATCAALVLLFLFISGAFTYGVISRMDLTLPEDWANLATILLGSFIGDAIGGALGYLFGYRTTSSLVRARSA